MNPVVPEQWIEMQRHQGRDVCLVLDALSESGVHQALLSTRAYDRYCSVYSQTPVAELAQAGPCLILLDPDDRGHLRELLNAPERHWGWLASIVRGHLPALLKHWRERFLIGTRPNLGLYRFQDNRVLARALEHLPQDTLPAYLGPAISACYWQGQCWAMTENPAPGDYPLPDAPGWLQVPMPAATAANIREANARRFLLEQHQQAFLHLAAQRPAQAWISQQRVLADTWGWWTSEQWEFLLSHSLKSPAFELPAQWYPRAQETPAEHFERIRLTAKFWAAEGEL